MFTLSQTDSLDLEGASMHHDGLMDVTNLTEEAALRAARLQLIDGKHHIQEGLIAAGVAALYDSVLCGMRYYIARHKRCASFVDNIDPWDAAALYHALVRAGVFDDPLTFNDFSRMVERALWQGGHALDSYSMLADVEIMLARLGVIPSTEPGLPDKPLAERHSIF
jgi:hypothetical protein